MENSFFPFSSPEHFMHRIIFMDFGRGNHVMSVGIPYSKFPNSLTQPELKLQPATSNTEKSFNFP